MTSDIGLALAVEQARLALPLHEVPIGAVVVVGDRVVGAGFNRRETDHNPLGHAELIALRAASVLLGAWRLENAELFVTLEPCPMCLAAIQQARVARVVFGAWDAKGGSLSLGHRLHEDARAHHRFIVEAHPSAECAAMLRDFFKSLRKS